MFVEWMSKSVNERINVVGKGCEWTNKDGWKDAHSSCPASGKPATASLTKDSVHTCSLWPCLHARCCIRRENESVSCSILSNSLEFSKQEFQYSCQENSRDRGAWQVAVHGVTKSRKRLSGWACTSMSLWIGGGYISSRDMWQGSKQLQSCIPLSSAKFQKGRIIDKIRMCAGIRWSTLLIWWTSLVPLILPPVVSWLLLTGLATVQIYSLELWEDHGGWSLTVSWGQRGLCALKSHRALLGIVYILVFCLFWGRGQYCERRNWGEQNLHN